MPEKEMLDLKIREEFSEVLFMRERLKDLYFLTHTLPKESKVFDEVISEKNDVNERLKSYDFSSTLSNNTSLLTILVYIYEHPFVRVTHKLFNEAEYIYYDDKDNLIRDESGNVFEDWCTDSDSSYNGIMMRHHEQWKTGWRKWIDFN